MQILVEIYPHYKGVMHNSVIVILTDRSTLCMSTNGFQQRNVKSGKKSLIPGHVDQKF